LEDENGKEKELMERKRKGERSKMEGSRKWGQKDDGQQWGIRSDWMGKSREKGDTRAKKKMGKICIHMCPNPSTNS
jgi:hypothetical protein